MSSVTRFGPMLLGLVLLGLIGQTFNSYQQLVLTLICLYSVIGAGLVLLLGAGGQLSLGHAAFLACGAYAAANVSLKTNWGLPGELAVALVVSAAAGIVVGLPSLRLSGLYLAIATYALGYAGQQLLYILKDFSGGGIGLSVGQLQIAGWQPPLLWVTLAFAAIAFFLTNNLLRGRTGRALHAIRTSESAATAVGIEVAQRRVVVFAISACLAAVGGLLYAHAVTYITPLDFNVQLSILLILMVLIGGQRRLLGAVLGAVFVIGVREQFREIQQFQGLVYGVILVLLIIFSPSGLAGLVDRLRLVLNQLVGRANRPLAQRVDVSANGHASAGAALELAPLVRATPLAARVSAASAAADEEWCQPGAPLEVRDVHVQFGGVVAVRELSLTLAAGEVMGLIGPNGAGKTTLFNAISGLAAYTGSITFGGRLLRVGMARQRARLGIGRTFQNLNLHEGLTVLEHVLIGQHRFLTYSTAAELVAWPTVRRHEQRAREHALGLLRLLDLDGLAELPVDELPYGLQKRVDIARALATRPRLLLLDEPAAGLPMSEAEALVDAVLALARPRGTSILIIEHNVELVSRMCARLVVMNTGRVLAEGAPAEILRNPAVVEAYIGG